MKALRECPKVSVMVITYNQEKFVRETIESVISQDYPNLEYVIADDGSTDSTQEIIKEYQRKFPDIIKAIIGNENVGISENSNRGLNACTGEFVALQGGDDVFLPGKIRAQVDWFQESSSRVLCGHLIKVCNELSEVTGNHTTQKVSGIGPNHWIKNGPLYGATSVMIRASALPRSGFDERMKIVSDWKLYIDSIGPNDEYGFINEYLAIYRRHSNNITNNVEFCLADVSKTLEILREDELHADSIIKKGFAYIYLYGHGLLAAKQGKHKTAFCHYVNALKVDPFLWKSYVRIIQNFVNQCITKLFKSKGRQQN